MSDTNRRPPSGAATLRADKTAAIAEAVLDELAEHGYGRIVDGGRPNGPEGKSALYRRWPSRQRMVIAVVSELSVALVEEPDTGSLRGDVLAALHLVADWLTHPRFSRILPDLIAEAQRDEELFQALARCIGEPRRARAIGILDRAAERGELPQDLDRELALDLLGGLVYWRVSARGAALEPGYFERAADMALRALGARPRGE